MFEESGYLQFIQKHEKVYLEEYNIEDLNEENAKQCNKKIQELAIADR